jgi:hypothetical protein
VVIPKDEVIWSPLELSEEAAERALKDRVDRSVRALFREMDEDTDQWAYRPADRMTQGCS